MENITVRRANVILTIPAYQKEEYLNKGFDVVNSQTGKVLEAAVPKDIGALVVKNEELQNKIKALTEENSKLKKQLKELKAAKDKTEEEEEFEELEEQEFVPINQRKSNKKKKS